MIDARLQRGLALLRLHRCEEALSEAQALAADHRGDAGGSPNILGLQVRALARLDWRDEARFAASDAMTVAAGLHAAPHEPALRESLAHLVRIRRDNSSFRGPGRCSFPIGRAVNVRKRTAARVQVLDPEHIEALA